MGKIKKSKSILFGIIAGFINGLLGAGGGMIVVPMLQSSLDTKKAHSTCVAVILPMTIVSAILYLVTGRVTIQDSYIYMIFGIPGAFIGSYLLQKINKKIIKKVFALLILWAGIKILFFRK